MRIKCLTSNVFDALTCFAATADRKKIMFFRFTGARLDAASWSLNCDLPGKDIETNLVATTVEMCRALCFSHPLCTHYTFWKDASMCYRKQGFRHVLDAKKDSADYCGFR